jgi:hypothetical protein
MDISNTLVTLEGRVIETPTLRYSPTSKQPTVVCITYLSLVAKLLIFFDKETRQRSLESVSRTITASLRHVNNARF